MTNFKATRAIISAVVSSVSTDESLKSENWAIVYESCLVYDIFYYFSL